MSGYYLVVHYAKDNQFTVVGDPQNKLKDYKRAQCEFNGEWKTGEIVYRGTKKACEGFASVKLADVNFEYTDSEANIEPTDTRETKSIYSYCLSFLEKYFFYRFIICY